MEILEFFRSIPVIRVLLPMILGIIAGIRIGINEKNIFFILLVCIVSLPILMFINKISLKPKASVIKGLSITVLFFIAGYCLPALYPADTELAEELAEGYWLCSVKDYPVERKKSYRTTLETIALCDSSHSSQTFNMLVYISKDSSIQHIKPGDLILIWGKPVRPNRSKNIHEFNYRNFFT
jgi:hypothetical protein